jgi:hypothetical protein
MALFFLYLYGYNSHIERARLSLLSQSWREILPTDEVRGLALQSLDAFPLRAADSFQFEASLAHRHFICADRRLALATKAAGFVTLELPATIP